MTTASVPATKAARQALVTSLLARQQVHSQVELADLLAAEGVTVTQATLSRDLALANRDSAAQPQLKDVPASTPAASTPKPSASKPAKPAPKPSAPAPKPPTTTASGNTVTSNPGASTNPGSTGGGAVGTTDQDNIYEKARRARQAVMVASTMDLVIFRAATDADLGSKCTGELCPIGATSPTVMAATWSTA